MSTDIYDPYPPTQNKYYKWYMNICVSRQQHNTKIGLIEHHIDPKSFYTKHAKDGWKETNPDIQKNFVYLTNKEHFLVHWLLCKCYEGLAKRKMCRAFHYMCKGNKNSKYYAISMKIYQSSFIYITKTCLTCSQNFEVVSSKHKQKYCSMKCTPKGKEHNPKWKGGDIETKCFICEEIFFVRPYLFGERICCSRKCGYHLRIFKSNSFLKNH